MQDQTAGINQELLAARFFLRSLEEAIHLQADRMECVADCGALVATLHAGGAEVKRIEMEASWLPVLERWIGGHDVTRLFETRSEESAATTIGMRLGDELLIADAEVEPGVRIKLSRFSLLTLDSVLRALSFAPAARAAFARIISAESGVVFHWIGPAQGEDEPIVSALTGSVSLSGLLAGDEISAAASSGLVLVRYGGADLFAGFPDALSRLPSDLPVRGMLSFALLPRPCRSCARAPVPEGGVCPECQGQGTSGVTAAASVLALTSELVASLHGGSPADVERIARSAGYIPPAGAPFTEGASTQAAESPAGLRAAAERQKRTRAAAGSAPRSILVVEDDPDQRELLAMLLSSLGYETRSAANGKEALTLLERAVPLLIVTDLMMPEMDGIELVRALRADARYRSVPVLVLTVIEDEEREFELLALGVDDYCRKGVQPRILQKRIENLARRAGILMERAK